MLEVAAQAGFVALAFFRLQVRIGFDDVALAEVFEATIQRLGRGGAEAFGVLAIPGVVIVEGIGHAELGRYPVPGLGVIVDGEGIVRVDGAQKFLGDVRLEFGVVVAQAGQEGPVVPADLVLGEQAVGVDGRVREVAGFLQHVRRAGSTDGGAAATDRQAGGVAAA
ncbi:hypothetical protein D3C81_1675890 [compost metagenome]